MRKLSLSCGLPRLLSATAGLTDWQNSQPGPMDVDHSIGCKKELPLAVRSEIWMNESLLYQ